MSTDWLENAAHPFDKLPETHREHVEQWLKSNHKEPADIKWSLYPLGMVGRWIERAEKAEAEYTEAIIEKHSSPLVVAADQLAQAAEKLRGRLTKDVHYLSGEPLTKVTLSPDSWEIAQEMQEFDTALANYKRAREG